MVKVFRCFGVVVITLLAVLLVAVVALQMLVDPDDYRELIRQKAAERQIELDIAGNIHWSLFPRPAIVAEDINAVLPLTDKQQALHIAQVSVALDLARLLHGQVGFSRVDISKADTVATGEAQPQRLEKIDITVSDFASDGRPFPLKLSLVYIKNNLQVPVMLSTMLSFDVVEQKIERVLLDQLDISVEGARIRGSIVWQQGSPAHTLFQLHSDDLAVRNLQFHNVALSAMLEGEKLSIATLQAEAYQGQLKASGLLNVSGEKNAVWKLDVAVQDMQLSPLLADWSQKKPGLSSGVLQGISTLTTLPNSRAGALGSLAGEMEFSILAAALEGQNLEKLACEAAARLDGKDLPKRAWSMQTELRDIRGVAQIKQGIAWLAPIKISMDALDIVGSGPVNLVNSTLDVQLDMKMLANRQAVNACEIFNPRLANINWPLRCKGNYAQQAGSEMCGMDKSRMSTLLLRAAQEKLQSGLDGKDEKIKDVLKGLLN